MNFEFSDDMQQIRGQAQALLREHGGKSARNALETQAGHDETLWARIAALGWLGTAIPEDHGGLGLGAEALCVMAEELGRSVAAVPFASSAYLAAQAILLFGDEAQKARLLPGLAAGTTIGTFALAERPGAPSAERVETSFAEGRLTGCKQPVADGGVAHLAVVAARQGDGIALVVTDLAASGTVRARLETVDPSRDSSAVTFAGSPGEILPLGRGWSSVELLLDRAAILFAFEQIGGAQAALDMARDYALERRAFGRQIGSFQAIKHKLATVYVAIELARSNAYYGAWALGAEAPDLTAAAAAARIAATHAYSLAAQENIQTHGGMGFTWEADCHLHYRRARHLALVNGAPPYWKDRLVAAIEHRNAA